MAVLKVSRSFFIRDLLADVAAAAAATAGRGECVYGVATLYDTHVLAPSPRGRSRRRVAAVSEN